MTADIRAAAQREADRRYQDDLDGFEDLCPDAQEGFVLGAAWAQARLTPTREQLVEVAEKVIGEFPARDLDPNKSWAQQEAEEVADAVFALIAGLAEGRANALRD